MSPLRSLFKTHGRGAATTFVWLVESALAWAFAAALGSALAAPLRHRPEGVFALYAEDGRLLLDWLRESASVLDASAGVVTALVGVWLVVGVLLGGFVPAVAAAKMAVPTVQEALADSVRRASTLIALTLLALLGHGAVGLLGWFAWRYVDRVTVPLADARVLDLRHALIVAVLALLVGLVRGWHGVARFHVMSEQARALPAAGAALIRLARSPLKTLGRGAMWSLVALVGTLVALGVGAALDRHRATWAVVTLTAAQQLALLWRVHCRMRWYGGLGDEPR